VTDQITIVQAGRDEIEEVVVLFDRYRQFYEQVTDPSRALSFIRERIERSESVIFLARHDTTEGQQAAGFVQLYPIFSSVSMIRVWLLNDLYVHPECRRLGVGRALMLRAIEHARETGYGRVELATAEDNRSAQMLYEDLGFTRATGFHHYSLSI
jgi:ribosomal protein S18 acetylase RimI-like enzyme